MALTIEELETLRQQKKESTPAPPKESNYKSPTIRASIEEARAAVEAKKMELEVKRLEKELERLEKPDTNLDYWAKMLEMTKEHNKQLLELQKQNYDTQLALAKMEYGEGGDFASDFLGDLIPLLPELLKKRAEAPKEAAKGGDDMAAKLPTASETEAYRKAVKAGVVSEQQAYDMVLEKYPELKDKVTRERFHEEFEKIKNS